MSPGGDDRGDPEREPGRRGPALLALAFMLALVVGVYFLVTALQRNSSLEDCLMAGRRNCAPIEPSPR